MKEYEQLFFTDRDSFRKWLETHHDRHSGFWMVYHKKHTGRAGISYEEALEEALCFGWIDSIIKRLDEEKYLRKFTPRIKCFGWSPRNRDIAIRLIREKKMTVHGLNKIGSYASKGILDWESAVPEKEDPAGLSPPAGLLEALKNNEPALQHFNEMAPSKRRHFIQWIAQAKREETRKKRINESVLLLKKNQALGMK